MNLRRKTATVHSAAVQTAALSVGIAWRARSPISLIEERQRGTTHVAYIVTCRGHRIEPGGCFCTRRYDHGTEIPRGDGGSAQGSRSQGGRAEIPRGNGAGGNSCRR